MKLCLPMLCLLLLVACSSRENAGGTTVETTNGLAVLIDPRTPRSPPPQGSFALRITGVEVQRLCVVHNEESLSYAFLGDDVWVRVDSLDDTLMNLEIHPDSSEFCPLPDSAAVFSAMDGYEAAMDLNGMHMDGSSQSVSLGSLSKPVQTFTLSAEVLLDSGLAGGEVLTIGNIVGFRMDHLGSKAGLYGYVSTAGASRWNVISGETPIGDSTWIRVDLVVDAPASRFEVYFNGRLHYASTDSLSAIAYDKGSLDMVLGKHALQNLYFFRGRVGMAVIASVARSPEWIRWSASQGRTGDGWIITEPQH